MSSGLDDEILILSFSAAAASVHVETGGAAGALPQSGEFSGGSGHPPTSQPPSLPRGVVDAVPVNCC